ncbi:hypothetical protein WJX84_008149, partial [Apatococcus fuscideae]
LFATILGLAAWPAQSQAPARAPAPTPTAAAAPPPFRRSPSAVYQVVIEPWNNLQTYTPISVPQGTELSFYWSGGHGVYLLPTAQCPEPGQYTPGAAYGQYILAGGLQGTARTSVNNNYTTALMTPGTYYFACQVGDHCSEDGQLQVVTVTASQTATMASLS